MVYTKIYGFIFVLLYAANFCMGRVTHVEYDENYNDGVNEYENDNYDEEFEGMGPDFRPRTNAHCPWTYQRNYQSESITMMSFAQFRNSQDRAVKIIDNFNTTVLSSTFVDRYKFKEYISNYRDVQSTWVKYLDLSSNKFEKIMPQTFEKVANCLHYLILTNNSISAISDMTFDGLHYLYYLDLSKNKLKFVKLYEWFKNMQLDYLNLSYNEIEDYWRSSERSHYPSSQIFQTLDMSHNKLQNYSNFDNCFVHRAFANYLNLSHNLITYIEIKDNASLYDINLSHNQLEKFDCSHLNNATNLISLNISSNKIYDFKCSSLIYLKVIDLANNRIQTFNQNMFKNFKNLTYLNLSQNKILLKPNMFKILPALKYLILKSNNFQSVPVRTFNGLSNLIVLNLQGNKLKYFEFGSFAGLYRLKKLDLSNNKIESVEINKLMDLDNLKSLLLDGNYLTELNLTDLNFKLNKLSTVSLNNMPWTCEHLANIKIELRKLNVTLKMVSYNNDFSNTINGVKCLTNSTGNDDTNKVFVEEYTDNSNLIVTERVDMQFINILTSTEESIIDSVVKISDNSAGDTIQNFIDKNQTSLSMSSDFVEKIENIIRRETNDIKENLMELKNFTLLILHKIDNFEQTTN